MKKNIYKLKGVDCANCGVKIENKLDKLNGIFSSNYVFMLERLEVIYDDRKVRPGVMFSDADLLGVPIRVIVSPKNLANGECELVTRDKTVNEKISLDNIKEEVHSLVTRLSKELKG